MCPGRTVPSIRYNYISLSSVYLTSSCYFYKKSNVQQTPSSWQPKPAFGSWFISDGQMFTKRSYQNGTSENDLLPSRASWFRCQVLMPELEKLSSHISLIARHHPNVGKKKTAVHVSEISHAYDSRFPQWHSSHCTLSKALKMLSCRGERGRSPWLLVGDMRFQYLTIPYTSQYLVRTRTQTWYSTSTPWNWYLSAH